MDFKEYLKTELEKPVNNEYYTSNGNSDRAVVLRGFYGEVVWQYKKYPSRLLGELKEFDGLSTELGWFIQIPLMILLSPIAPIFAANHWYKKSIREYKKCYQQTKQDALMSE